MRDPDGTKPPTRGITPTPSQEPLPHPQPSQQPPGQRHTLPLCPFVSLHLFPWWLDPRPTAELGGEPREDKVPTGGAQMQNRTPAETTQRPQPLPGTGGKRTA
eukprot:CAMPEP_0174271398 /NCGR_PEP_ID=MMETSP0439-20130205/47764_1 /TAXON_ID=0 /ORGANISM="Stereomyxa ramosa, Strain Chinc5" /LENGTH=102 /DNA_ID=CAMNT_0015361377 /DNA_START=169 /DNA_END=475 /DNA_ORIENTATION=-